jgi:hypothetical protein
VFTVFLPSPSEWAAVTGKTGQFPSDFTWTYFGDAVARHLAFWNNYISPLFLINIIDFTFLTVFIWHIEKDYRELKNHTLSVYIEWAMLGLISGIIYFSGIITTGFTWGRVSAIVVFALILYPVLYYFRKELKQNEYDEEKAFNEAKNKQIKEKEDNPKSNTNTSTSTATQIT